MRPRGISACAAVPSPRRNFVGRVSKQNIQITSGRARLATSAKSKFISRHFSSRRWSLKAVVGRAGWPRTAGRPAGQASASRRARRGRLQLSPRTTLGFRQAPSQQQAGRRAS